MPSSPSLAGRALMAVGLMIGFYLLALVMVGGLLFLVYADVVIGHRIHFKLVIFAVIGALTILWSILPRIDKFNPPGRN